MPCLADIGGKSIPDRINSKSKVLRCMVLGMFTDLYSYNQVSETVIGDEANA